MQSSTPHFHLAGPSCYPSVASSSPSSISLARKNRTLQACVSCRRKRIKCSGQLGGCSQCAERELTCRYEAVPDDEKLKVRSYKRQLRHRRAQLRHQRMILDSNIFAAALGMHSSEAQPRADGFAAACSYASPEMQAQDSPLNGMYSPQDAYFQPSQAPMQQTQPLSPAFASPSACGTMEEDLKQFFASFSLPETSSRLQNVTGTSSLSQRISAPLFLEPLHHSSALSSSLSSPTLSASSSSSSLSTPSSECFSDLHTSLSTPFASSVSSEKFACASSQVHFHDFAGGLELYNVPCMAPAVQASAISPPAAPAGSSASSSPEHALFSLPSTFDFGLMLESAVASSTLAGAFA